VSLSVCLVEGVRGGGLSFIFSRWVNKVMTSRSNELHTVSQERLTLIVDGVNLSVDAQVQAQSYVTKLIEDESVSVSAETIHRVVAGAVLIASRETGDVRTANEISEHTPSSVGEQAVHEASRVVCEVFDLGVVLADPADYVRRISNALDAPAHDRQVTLSLVEVANTHTVFPTETPQTIAAAAFYYMSVYGSETQTYTQDDVTSVVDVSKPPINDNYKKFHTDTPVPALDDVPVTPPT